MSETTTIDLAAIKRQAALFTDAYPTDPFGTGVLALIQIAETTDQAAAEYEASGDITDGTWYLLDERLSRFDFGAA
jgi:hypothetical protein